VHILDARRCRKKRLEKHRKESNTLKYIAYAVAQHPQRTMYREGWKWEPGAKPAALAQ